MYLSVCLCVAVTGVIHARAVLVGGRELPFEAFRSTSRLDLFDLTINSWLKHHDIEGAISSRIGHSVVTVGDNVYAFGGELLASWEALEHPISHLNDIHELSFVDNVLHCRALSTAAPSHDPAAAGDTDASAVPCERAWHASASVKYGSSDTEGRSGAVLVLGGKDSRGKLLADVWLLVLKRSHGGDDPAAAVDDNKASCGVVTPRWIQISPTGNSPLPLAHHRAVPIGGGDQVAVIGGIAPSRVMLESVFVLDLVGNAWSTVSLSLGPSPSISASSRDLLAPDPHAAPSMTARCCFSALSLVLPMEEPPTDNVVLFSEEIPLEAMNEKHEQLARDIILIFGGFSLASPALPTTSCVLLDIANSFVRELRIPNAGVQSYMGHACVSSADRKSLYVFGGVDPHSNLFLDTTSALHFWRPQPLADGLEDDAANANANPIKTKRFDNGDVYVGDMDLSVAAAPLRHGRGKCTYANGDEYDGDWERDQRCGQGTMTFSNGDMYAGQWADDQYHGYGILQRRVVGTKQQQRVEITHDGLWSGGDKAGSGTTTYSDGSQLVAVWHSGGLVRDGRLENFDDGNGVCHYVGQVAADGLPDGQGRSEHATGESYSGQWRSGKRCGHGVATLADGTTYTGDWRNGKRNGFGACEYARTRDVYKGKWVGGVRCGRGVCTYANGSAYDGEWDGDKCHGLGRFTFAGSSSFYEGSWQENRFCGDGALVLNDGGGDAESVASASSPSTWSLRAG